MTRFEKELSGALGAYWKKSAEKELEKVREELKQGLITIDENGVARNRIGRVLMSDMLEKLTYITDAVDAEATTKAREEENTKALEEYKKNAAEATTKAREEETAKALEEYRKNARPATEEELDEMRAAFGKGKTVVNIITGQKYHL